MTKKELKNFFENYLEKQPLFTDKSIMQSAYTPEDIPHREVQIGQIANILAPCLRMEKPSNLFVYGKTGTGKTVCVRHTTNQILEIGKEKQINVKVIYLNCKLGKIADTEYRLVAQLAREFGKEIPATGLPTQEVYKIFFSALDREKQVVLIILDEIDQLIKKTGDEILYIFTRVNGELKNASLSIIGISNDLIFVDNLDPRVKSSLSEEELLFPPYNALQIQDILQQRVKKAFRENVVEEGLIAKCAAYAAREHGDARRALELLRVAGEITERAGEEKIKIKYLDEAEDKLEKDRILDIVKTQPPQFQATLFAALSVNKQNNIIFTGDLYNIYKTICAKTSLRPLTQRRVSDIIAEFDMLGLVNTKVISKGRYGRTREISLAIPQATEPKVRDILIKELNLN